MAMITYKQSPRNSFEIFEISYIFLIDSNLLNKFSRLHFREFTSYDRRNLEKVSPFLAKQVSKLLRTDPRRRPAAEQMLVRLNDD